MAHNAGVFFSYGMAKTITGADQLGAPLCTYFLAGSLAAVPISIVESPVDLLKIKLQSQVGEGEYKVCWFLKSVFVNVNLILLQNG